MAEQEGVGVVSPLAAALQCALAAARPSRLATARQFALAAVYQRPLEVVNQCLLAAALPCSLATVTAGYSALSRRCTRARLGNAGARGKRCESLGPPVTEDRRSQRGEKAEERREVVAMPSLRGQTSVARKLEECGRWERSGKSVLHGRLLSTRSPRKTERQRGRRLVALLRRRLGGSVPAGDPRGVQARECCGLALRVVADQRLYGMRRGRQEAARVAHLSQVFLPVLLPVMGFASRARGASPSSARLADDQSGGRARPSRRRVATMRASPERQC